MPLKELLDPSSGDPWIILWTNTYVFQRNRAKIGFDVATVRIWSPLDLAPIGKVPVKNVVHATKLGFVRP